MIYLVKHISVSITRPPKEVYAFIANPENLPMWASGLSSGISKSGDEWIAESPMGKVTVRFAEANAFGVLDHDVILASGQLFHNPMRVLANGAGSEVVFTLYRLPEMTDLEFAKDAKIIEDDLFKLKRLLE